MDIQLNILGEDSFKTDEDFCAVFVDVVLPIDEEPECMRFVEDVSHETPEVCRSCAPLAQDCL